MNQLEDKTTRRISRFAITVPALLAAALVVFTFTALIYLKGHRTQSRFEHLDEQAGPQLRILVSKGYLGPIYVHVDETRESAKKQTHERIEINGDQRIARKQTVYEFHASASGLVPIARADERLFESWHGIDVFDSNGTKLHCHGGPRVVF